LDAHFRESLAGSGSVCFQIPLRQDQEYWVALSAGSQYSATCFLVALSAGMVASSAKMAELSVSSALTVASMVSIRQMAD
jgi:hypothetical protein